MAVHDGIHVRTQFVDFAMDESFDVRAASGSVLHVTFVVDFYDVVGGDGCWRDTAGENNDMLVKSAKLGKALAHSLGEHSFALMRGHGSVTVADSIKLVVARSIWAEMNAKLQTEAMRLAQLAGDDSINYLTPGEAEGSMTINETVVDRPWDFWKAKARVALAGLKR